VGEVNYFEYHLGDYAKDAGHLTMIRDGAYLRLMAAYYSREKPLPLDLEECFDLTRCASKAEREAVEYVLRKFFTRAEDGYHQKRCDEEIDRLRRKSEAGRTGANARWGHNGRNANGSGVAMRSQSSGNAPNLQSPDSNHQTPEDTPPTPSRGRVRVEGKPSTWKPPSEAEMSGEAFRERKA
jgi:uncharacterized protein YdaU (DUF1376 family)